MRAALVIFLMLGFSANLYAIDQKKVDTKFGSDLPIKSEHMIEVKSYDPKSQSYEVVAVQFPGEGSTFVTPEGLARAIKTIDLARIKRSPETIVGQQFKTDKDLPGLTEKELKLRIKK